MIVQDRERKLDLKQQTIKFFESLLAASIDGIVITDSTHSIIVANKTFCSFFGQDCRNMLETSLLDWLNQYTDQGLRLWSEIDKEVRLRGSCQNIEFSLMASKETRYLSVNASALEQTENEEACIICIWRDITERKQTERQIKKQKELLSNVFESITNPLYVIDANDYTITMANNALNAGDLSPKKTCYELTHRNGVPCDDKENPCPLEEVKSTKKLVTVEHIHYDKAGNPKYVEVNGYPLFDDKGNVSQMIVYTIDITERKQAENQIKQSLMELSILNKLSQEVISHLSLKQTVKTAIDGVFDAINPDLVLFFLRDDDNLLLQGFRASTPKYCHEETPIHRVGECLCGLSVSERKAIYSLDIRNDPRCKWEECKKAGLRSFAALPLLHNNDVIGILGLASGTQRDFSNQSTFLETISNDISIGLQNSILYERLQKYNISLSRANEKITMAMDGIINALALTVEQRDPYTSGHQQRVAKLGCAIAEEMGMPKDQIEGIRMAGIIHDIGKMHIPIEILSRPGKLTEWEFNIVRTHAQVSYDILKGIEFPWPVADIVHQHHEKMDGSGYPLGLSNGDILMEARILCVADVVEAMASHRPYRPALGMDKALEEISKKKGIHYDAKVVSACLKIIKGGKFEFED